MKTRLISAMLLLSVVFSSCGNVRTENSSSLPESSPPSSSSQPQNEQPVSSEEESPSPPNSSTAENTPSVSETDFTKYAGYNSLSGNLKEAYAAVTNALLNHSSSVNLSRYNLSRANVFKVVQFVFCDRPDIFWVEKEYSLIASSDYIQAITFKYSLTASEVNEKKAVINNSVSSYLSALSGKSTYEKIKGAHDMIIASTSYKDNTDAHNICGVFINKSAVCEGYAKAFQLIMQKLGIPCYIVHGKSGGVNHVWNLVSVDGKYYHIDLTMDDPVGVNLTAYTYFLLNDTQIKSNHSITPDYNIPLPAASNDAMNYYVYENRYIVSYNTDNITEIIVSDINNGRKYSEMRFSSNADLDRAKQKLALTDLKRTIANKLGKTVNWNIIETTANGTPPVYDLILKLSY